MEYYPVVAGVLCRLQYPLSLRKQLLYPSKEVIGVGYLCRVRSLDQEFREMLA